MRARVVVAMVLLALCTAVVFAEDAVYSDEQSVVGPVVLHELAVTDATLVFRVASGGCTDASSFTVDADRSAPLHAGVPHVRLTIRRTRPDSCKAFLPEGVEVTIDLRAEFGLTGRFTVAVANPVLSAGSGAEGTVADGAPGLRESPRIATLDAIRSEADAVSERLKNAEADGASRETNERRTDRYSRRCHAISW